MKWILQEYWKSTLHIVKHNFSVLPKNIARFFEIIKTYHTANEGPVRIQYKCLVLIYAFPEMKILFPEQNYNVLSPSSYSFYERFIYIQDRSAYAGKYRMWNNPMEYIYRSQTHEYENWIWDWGRTIPRKEIHKWDFPCSTWKFRPIVYMSKGHFLTPCLYYTVRWWHWWCRRPHGDPWRAGPPWAASAPYRTAAPRSAALFVAASSACLTGSVPGLGSQVLKWKKHSCRTGTAGTVTFCLRGTGNRN